MNEKLLATGQALLTAYVQNKLQSMGTGCYRSTNNRLPCAVGFLMTSEELDVIETSDLGGRHWNTERFDRLAHRFPQIAQRIQDDTGLTVQALINLQMAFDRNAPSVFLRQVDIETGTKAMS